MSEPTWNEIMAEMEGKDAYYRGRRRGTPSALGRHGIRVETGLDRDDSNNPDEVVLVREPEVETSGEPVGEE